MCASVGRRTEAARDVADGAEIGLERGRPSGVVAWWGVGAGSFGTAAPRRSLFALLAVGYSLEGRFLRPPFAQIERPRRPSLQHADAKE